MTGPNMQVDFIVNFFLDACMDTSNGSPTKRNLADRSVTTNGGQTIGQKMVNTKRSTEEPDVQVVKWSVLNETKKWSFASRAESDIDQRERTKCDKRWRIWEKHSHGGKWIGKEEFAYVRKEVKRVTKVDYELFHLNQECVNYFKNANKAVCRIVCQIMES